MRVWLSAVVATLVLGWATPGAAATYYVRNGGNDSADGKSHATAWATLDKVNKFAFAPGDVVLLHEGHRWVGKVTLDWPGTSTVRSVLGAYYLNGSTPVRGYKTARPIIDGEDKLPTGRYDALVLVTATRARVENLRVEDSEGRGIDIAKIDDVEVFGCAVYNTYNAGIHFEKSKGSRAENNFVTGAGIGNRQDGAPWGASLEAVKSESTVFRNNIVSEVFGEGINAHSGSNNTLIENNYVFGARAVGIYSDGAPNTIIRRNIVVGTANKTYWRSATSVGAGIALNNEKYHYPAGGGSQSTSVQSRGVKVYGNLVAYTSAGLAFWGELDQSSFDNVLVYNNTFVDNNTQVTSSSKPKPGAQFINNVLLSLSSGTKDVDGTKLGGMVARNNYFSQGNPGGDYVHAGNRFTGLKLAKMSGWRSVTSANQITWRDFAAQGGSTVIGAGDDTPRKSADGRNNYNLDHNGAEHDAPMSMGGLSFSTPIGPQAPSSLVVSRRPEFLIVKL